jgi:hypothetical protein
MKSARGEENTQNRISCAANKTFWCTKRSKKQENVIKKIRKGYYIREQFDSLSVIFRGKGFHTQILPKTRK